MDMQKDLISILGCIFSILGGFIAIIFIIIRRHTDLPIKFIGSFFVLALCFFANHWFAYTIGIFIIATLVTELEFLEKLAAISWGRKEYFDYLMRKATTKEIKEKNEKDYQKIRSLTHGKKYTEEIQLNKIVYVQESLRFEKEVLDALTIKEKGGFLPKHHLRKQVSVKAADSKAIFDAIADYDKFYFIIEVKKSVNLSLLSQAAMQIRRNSYIFERYLYEMRRRGKVRLLLISPPAGVDGIDGIPLLQYDKTKKRFINSDNVFRYLTEDEDINDFEQ